MQLRRTAEDTTQETSFQAWSDFYAHLLKLFARKEGIAFKDGRIDQKCKDGKAGDKDFDLCMSEHFIEGQITDISVFDKDGKEFKIGDPKNPTLPKNPSRFVTHLEYMDLEYKAEESGEKIHVTGFQYDFFSENTEEAYKAGLERAKAALNMAYTAQAMGWTKVDFGNTTDPVERQMLIKACQHVGLDYGEEKPSQSSVKGVQVTPVSIENSAAINEALDAINKNPNMPDDQKQNVNPVMVAVNQAFTRFVENPRAPVGAKEKPSAKRTAPEPAAPAAAAVGM
jgi:hypothetical protein